MVSFQSLSKDADSRSLPSDSRNLILLHPLLIKRSHLEKKSPVLIETQNGNLLFNCWPHKSCEETNAVLPAFNLFKHYTTSSFNVHTFKGHLSLAQRVHLYPMKFRSFMNTRPFKSFLKKKLGQVYLREGLVLHIKYLGYPCQFIIKNIYESYLKSFKDSVQCNLSLKYKILALEQSFSEQIDLNQFTESKFHCSTPVSSPRVSSVKHSSETKLSLHDQVGNCKLKELELFYSVSKDTKFLIDNPQLTGKPKTFFEDIYGLCKEINEVKFIINSILIGDSSNVTKGILITGPNGSGKSTILQVVKNEYEKKLSVFDCKDIINIKSSISLLKQLFKQSKEESPCLIIFDNIDKFCEDLNSSGSTTQELTSLMSDLLNSSTDILLLATSQSEFSTPSILQQNGLLDKKISVSVPPTDIRKQILEKFLKNYDTSLKTDEVTEISEMAHGFTGGDLQRLCFKAHSISCIEKYYNSSISEGITIAHFRKSFTFIKPSSVAEFTFEVPNVKWEDIGGMDEVKNVVKEMVDWPLKYPEQCKKFCFTPPRGVLLYGPPGVAKTMIAKALATESKINFINVELSGILNKYVGESEKAVSELFKKARSASPCVLFIDEIDAVAPKRGSSGGCSDAIDRIVSQLLIEIDGIDVLQKGVCIMAATNRPDMIDPSLLRPGRLDCCIYVGLPDQTSRKLIFEVSLRQRYMSADVDIDFLSRSSENYTGAEVVQLCDEASKMAIEESISSGETVAVNMKHLLNALTKVQPRTSKEMLEMFENYNKKFAS